MSEDEIPMTEEELYAWFQWYEETHPKSRRALNPKYANNIMPSNPRKDMKTMHRIRVK